MGRPAKNRQSKVYPAKGESPLERTVKNLKADPETANRIEKGRGAIEIPKPEKPLSKILIEEASAKSEARSKAAARAAKTKTGEVRRLQKIADDQAARQQRLSREIARASGAAKTNPVEAVVRAGLNPDSVLRPIIACTDASGRKTADAPIEYLAYRVSVENAIVADQYRAAKLYEGMFESLRAVASNTDSAIKRLSDCEPWSQSDIDKMNSGEMLRPFETTKIPNTEMTAGQILSRIKRIRSRLDRLDVSILDDLLLRQFTIGVIAGRWGFSHEQMSALVKVALWRLVTVMESVDAEFRAEAIARRQFEGEFMR